MSCRDCYSASQKKAPDTTECILIIFIKTASRSLTRSSLEIHAISSDNLDHLIAAKLQEIPLFTGIIQYASNQLFLRHILILFAVKPVGVSHCTFLKVSSRPGVSPASTCC